jgi:hypothetical protein
MFLFAHEHIEFFLNWSTKCAFKFPFPKYMKFSTWRVFSDPTLPLFMYECVTKIYEKFMLSSYMINNYIISSRIIQVIKLISIHRQWGLAPHFMRHLIYLSTNLKVETYSTTAFVYFNQQARLVDKRLTSIGYFY